MDRKIRVGAVSYLNTKPLLYGIQRSDIMNDILLTIDYPSRIAEMLLADEIDMGLVPVAIIPEMETYYINTDYCIGSNGPVASVCLFSECPVEDIEKVLLDYQSRTSVELAGILLKEYWKLQPELIHGGPDFRNQIGGRVAGVVIGDRALEQRKRSSYIYDLGEAWKKLTGLPFVYAAWISNKRLDEDFVRRFDAANSDGVRHISALLNELNDDVFDLHEYYSRHISYELNASKRAGLKMFIEKLSGDKEVYL